MPYSTYIAHENHTLINNMHRYYADKFNMNILDIQEYYDKNQLNEFSKKFGAHQLSNIMFEIGYQILKNTHLISNISKPTKNLDIKFKIISHDEFGNNFNIQSVKNSIFNEKFIRISKNDTINLKLDDEYYLAGIHSWNNGECKTAQPYYTYSALSFVSDEKQLIKEAAFLNQFNDISSNFKINNQTIINLNSDNKICTEYSEGVYSYNNEAKRIEYFDLISLFLINKNELLNLEEIKYKFNTPIKPNNDLGNIIPNIKMAELSINEYIKTFPTQPKIIIRDKEKLVFNNISTNKPATQSSISQWSKPNDAIRALSGELSNDDFAFHTNLEDNPWWMVDLEKEEYIYNIYIQNRIKMCKEKAKTIQVEISLDKENWTLIPNEYLKWTNLDYLNVELLNKYKARYVKLSLREKNYFHLAKVEVYALNDKVIEACRNLNDITKKNIDENLKANIIELIRKQNEVLERLL